MKTVFITGANRGIGLGLLEHYLKRGHKVIVGVRDVSAQSLVDLAAEYGDQLSLLQLDVGDESSIHSLATKLSASKIHLDLVINNAGFCAEQGLSEWTAANFEVHFRVNTIGPLLIAQALLPLMPEGSKLVNVSSGMGSLEYNINPTAGLDAYAASKAALNSLTHRLAEKVRAQGVVVVAMSPGWVQTEMGGADATTSVAEAIASITSTIETLRLDQSGAFLNEAGEGLAW